MHARSRPIPLVLALVVGCGLELGELRSRAEPEPEARPTPPTVADRQDASKLERKPTNAKAPDAPAPRPSAVPEPAAPTEDSPTPVETGDTPLDPVVPDSGPADPASEVLPAGMDWRHDAYSICDQRDRPQRCVAAGAAVVTHTEVSDAEVPRLLAKIGRKGLALGYPMVVFSNDLGLELQAHEGVVIVLGLFVTEDAALRWRSEHRPRAMVEVIAEKRPDKTSDERRRVIRLRPGGPVPVWSEAPIGTLPNPAVPSGAPPKKLCTLDGGDMTTTTEELAYRDVYAGAPVSCPDGKTHGFVAWTDTLLDATFGVDSSGKRHRWQIVDAECDSPIFARWPVDPNGVTTGAPVLFGPDC